MNPSADDIARALVAAANVTGAKPLDVYKGQFSGIYGGKVGKARAAVMFCLAGCWGRMAQDWAVWFGWNANESAAIQVVHRHRRGGLLAGRELAAAARALGLDPKDVKERDDAVITACRKRRSAKAKQSRAEKQKQRIAEAEARCKETAHAARREAEKAPQAKPPVSARPCRVIGSRSANVTKPEPAKPTIAPVTSESDAIDRYLRSIPERRAI